MIRGRPLRPRDGLVERIGDYLDGGVRDVGEDSSQLRAVAALIEDGSLLDPVEVDGIVDPHPQSRLLSTSSRPAGWDCDDQVGVEGLPHDAARGAHGPGGGYFVMLIRGQFPVVAAGTAAG